GGRGARAPCPAGAVRAPDPGLRRLLARLLAHLPGRLVRRPIRRPARAPEAHPAPPSRRGDRDAVPDAGGGAAFVRRAAPPAPVLTGGPARHHDREADPRRAVTARPLDEGAEDRRRSVTPREERASPDPDEAEARGDGGNP